MDDLEATSGQWAGMTGRRPTMLDVILDSGKQRILRVLCVGARCDDIDIGCGGVPLELLVPACIPLFIKDKQRIEVI